MYQVYLYYSQLFFSTYTFFTPSEERSWVPYSHLLTQCLAHSKQYIFFKLFFKEACSKVVASLFLYLQNNFRKDSLSFKCNLDLILKCILILKTGKQNFAEFKFLKRDLSRKMSDHIDNLNY